MKRQRSPSSIADDGSEPEAKARRHWTLFDVAAGKVTSSGWQKQSVPQGEHTDYLGGARPPLRPDEVLYKRKNAPDRFEETDTYFSHATLPAQLALPDSDLLASIHAYVSQYYAKMPRRDRNKAWRSMDETALLAMGILIEEAVRERLGENGDLVFVEGEDDDGSPANRTESSDPFGRGRSNTSL